MQLPKRGKGKKKGEKCHHVEKDRRTCSIQDSGGGKPHIAKNVDQFTRTKTSGEWQGKGKNTSEQQVLVR